MRFGVCSSVANGGILRAAGWDYVEANVQELLQAEVADGQWKGAELAGGCGLPVEAGNLLVPGHMKITGGSVNAPGLREYMRTVMDRAEKVGIRTLVFGAGNARKVEEGFDRNAARGQVLEFVKMAAALAGERGISLVAEPLNRKECNILNSVTEAMGYVRALGRPSFQCLVDSYHFWAEEESLGSLAAAMPWIRHVHVADKGSRLAPGQSEDLGATREVEYRAFFKVLKVGGYDGRISVESGWKPELAKDAAVVLARLKRWWAEA